MNRFYRKPKPETMKKNREFYRANFNDEIEWLKNNLELIKEDKFLIDMYTILITGSRKMTPKMVDAIRKGMKNPMYNQVTRIERMEKIKPILEKIHMVKSIIQEKDKNKSDWCINKYSSINFVNSFEKQLQKNGKLSKKKMESLNKV